MGEIANRHRAFKMSEALWVAGDEMFSTGRGRFVLGISLAALAATAAPAVAQTSADEQALIQALDRAFKPGLLNTDGKRRLPDGSYARMVSTGDAVTKQTIASPLNAVRAACSASGNKFDRVISAGKAGEDGASRTIAIAGERLTVDRAQL